MAVSRKKCRLCNIKGSSSAFWAVESSCQINFYIDFWGVSSWIAALVMLVFVGLSQSMCHLEQYQVVLSSITVQRMQQQVLLRSMSKLQTNSAQILFSTHISAYDRLVNHSYRMLNVSYEAYCQYSSVVNFLSKNCSSVLPNICLLWM